MAILELIRLREVIAMQKGIFGSIEVLRNRENLEPSSEQNNQEAEEFPEKEIEELSVQKNEEPVQAQDPTVEQSDSSKNSELT